MPKIGLEMPAILAVIAGAYPVTSGAAAARAPGGLERAAVPPAFYPAAATPGLILTVTFAITALLFALLLFIRRRDRRIAADLRESSDSLRSLIANLPGVAFRFRQDEAGTVILISDEIERLTGYPPSDFAGNGARGLRDVVHPDDWERFDAAVRASVAGRKPFDVVLRLGNEGGGVTWVQAKGQGVFDAHGGLRWIDGVLMDITHRRMAEAERERLMVAIEQAAEIIIITDTAGAIQYVNPSFERITGYTRAEALGANCRILKSGRQDEAFYKDMWRRLSGGLPWRGRFVNKRKDGTLYTEDAHISPVLDAQGKIANYVAVKRDITGEIEIEAQYRNTQKFEAIGRLAGGVAHDFNNMLQAILGHSEIAMETLDPDNPAREDLRAVCRAARRAADLTRQLLAFASRQPIMPQLLDLRLIVDNTLKTIQEKLGDRIELRWQPAEDLWRVKMDPIQIDQALMNLCGNAADALAGAGLIEVTARNLVLTAAAAAGHVDLQAGEYVVLSVRDNGPGMDDIVKAHIFEPFFTTKGVGRGSGLGLATTYGIVRQNLGAIEVASAPGRGAEFVIYLPRARDGESEPVTAGRQAGKAAALAGGDETILLVDDEPQALAVARAMLKQLGYAVLPASRPEEALRLAEEHAGRIDLLLTDVVMPGMDGWNLSRRLASANPRMACLFMSGYTTDILGQKGVVDQGVDFIQKPFNASVLAEKVRLILDRNRESS